MDPVTSTALAGLNRAFYERFAGDFARTRRAWPPGFDRILPHIGAAINLLDLGCGNARLLAFLTERGWRGSYLGIDASAGLLSIAAGSPGPGLSARFAQADLLDPGWPQQVRAAASPEAARDCPADAIALLAVLQHIPGAAARDRTLADCASLLAPGGRLVISTWQFMSAPRLRARVLPWSAAGLSEADVDPGDYLLSWGEGASGRRYCAFIQRDELCALAASAGLETVETFYADGQEGNLNLYGIFRRPA